MQLIRERGVVLFDHPRTRDRLAFRFDSRRALDRFVARVTGQPDSVALDIACQYVREGRATPTEVV